MKKRALQLASVASMIDQFNISNIKILQLLGYQVDVVADFSNPGTISREHCDDLMKRLSDMNVKIFDVAIPRTLNIFSIISAYRTVKKILKYNHYDLLHCHSPIGSVIARQAAKNIRKKGMKVVYTAHGFHFYKGAPFKNWLIYYPIEKLMSRYTDVLITINHEDYQIASKKFNAKKTVYVPGVGIDTKKFAFKNSKIINIRQDLGISNNEVLLLSVGELNKNKNHSVIIRALKKTESKVHYAIAGKGELKEYLENVARKYGVLNRVHLLGFRNDISDLYAAADICVFPSIREGLGLAAIEGMASGLPLIVSDNRGTREIIGDENGITCKYDDVDSFANAINKLTKDTSLRHKLGDKNRSVAYNFDFEKVNKIMMEIYNMSAK